MIFPCGRYGLIFFLGTWAVHVWAVIAPPTPAGSSYYEIVDKLEAYGCAYPTLRALAPQTQADLRSALVNDTEEFSCLAPRGLLAERERLAPYPFPPELRIEAVALQNDRRPLIGMSSYVLPMVPMREGRQTYNGASLYFELNAAAAAQSGDFGVAFGATPGWVGGLDDYADAKGLFYLQEGFLKVGYGWSEFTFGRSALRFGQTKHGGLLLSGAAAPLDLYKFAMRPHFVGETLGFLGPVTLETWVASQGGDPPVPGAHLWGIELGLRPLRALELSLIELFQFGGSGAPSLEVGDYFKMAAYANSDDLAAKRNRSLALHLGFWPASRSLKVYTQTFFSDLGPVAQWFFNDVSLLAGFWFPKIGDGDLRLEYVRTSPNAYQHPFWTQGLSYKQTTLGHPLGPDAEGAYLDAGFSELVGWKPDLGLIYESRFRHPTRGLFTEWRYGGSLGVKKVWGALDIQLKGVYHYIVNPSYLNSGPLNSFAGQAVVRLGFF